MIIELYVGIIKAIEIQVTLHVEYKIYKLTPLARNNYVEGG